MIIGIIAKITKGEIIMGGGVSRFKKVNKYKCSEENSAVIII